MQEEKLCVSVVPIFNHLDYDLQKEIADLSTTFEFAKHTTLFNAGDKADRLFIIHAGKVKLYAIDEAGKEHLYDVLESGDYIGETSLFLNEHYTKFAETLEDSSICVIDKEDFMKLLERYPTISIRILEEFAKRLDKAHHQSEMIANDSSEVRLLRYLESISERKGNKVIAKTLLAKKDIASHLGMSAETMSRSLKRLEKDGEILRLSNKEIEILNYKH